MTDNRTFKMSEQGSDFQKFGPGNRLSLSAVKNLPNQTAQFFNQFYSPNVFSLVIVDSQPIDVLTSLVVSKFGMLPNKNVSEYTFSKTPFPKDRMG